jgi:uncharacterized protein YjbJ (UPF0337 family)
MTHGTRIAANRARKMLRRRWAQLKRAVKVQWDRLSDGDLDELEGDVDRLVERLQQRYGLARRQAEHDVEIWLQSLRRPVPPPP